MLTYFRISHRFLFAGMMVMACCTSPSDETPMVVGNLRCEYLVDPLGIDATHPRLSWELSSAARGKRQTAYRIMMAGDSVSLARNRPGVWDTQKILSDATHGVPYAGPPLKSGQFYYWKVQTWDEQDRPGEWSPMARFSMGLTNETDWTAQWIGAKPEAIPLKDQYYNHRGYQSNVSARANAKKEVIIDLGDVNGVEEIRLHPAVPPGQTKGSYLFPVRFRVDLSTDAKFSTITTPINETENDHTSHSDVPFIKQFPSQLARYAKITVTQLAAVPGKGFAFALAEVEVIHRGVNRALHKTVSTSDVNRMGFWASDNWEKERLTDGFLKPNDNPPYSLPVPPSLLLRKSFSMTKPIHRAVLYITALGLYEARINGLKVGHQLLAPEFTDYRTRVQYQTYDVTRMLQRNENVIGVTLADGWYAGAIFSHPDRGSYGFDRRMRAQLEMIYTDGTRETVNTDGSWEVLSNGPLRRASLYDGEDYDARLEPTGWNQPGYAPSPAQSKRWEKASIDTSIHLAVSAQMNEPIQAVMELHPVRILEPRKGVYIFDMGQNMVGWCRLSLPYSPEHPITLRHAEVLQDDSILYVDNLRAAQQTDRYTPAEEARVSYEPRFTYHGFRYVEITGLTRRPLPNVITGIVVASAAAAQGR
jgi:alpha-L-rhamnosidase